MLAYDAGSATFRGTPTEIDDLARDLESLEGRPATDLLRARGIASPAAGDDLVTAMSAALASSLFTVELVVTGPGAHHRHDIDAGQNAVGVRRSPLTDDLAELSGFPMVTLPGGMTRAVRFLPGTAPAPEAETVALPTEAVVDLGAVEDSSRRRAWDSVQPLFAAAGHAPSEDGSWQLTQSRACWLSAEGEAAENFAVHLRLGTTYFVAIETDEGIDLVPVPSITAWESMIQVLPSAHEIGRPR